jgi:lipopolysaccharide transport protein LptA
MAVSFPDRRALLAALLLPLTALQAGAPGGLPGGSGGEIDLEADSWEIHYATNRLSFAGVVISQGPGVRIQARRAEVSGPELSFNGSRWEFTGDVNLKLEGGTLQADRAIVLFQGNRVAQATATGSPAKFEQHHEKLPRPAEGTAGRIEYDVAKGRVRLDEGTWFSDGRNEYRSPSLVYDVRERRVQSGGEAVAPETEGGGRIHITIRPDDTEAPRLTPSPQPAPAAP